MAWSGRARPLNLKFGVYLRRLGETLGLQRGIMTMTRADNFKQMSFADWAMKP